MTLFLHEIKRSKLQLIIWSSVMAFMLAVCVVIYPEMASQMGELNDMFSNMGAFSDAFGMDQLNFGEFMGYFGVECSNTLGMGGSIFAAILGISALAGEEKNGTAEFLLSHPISRIRVTVEKLLAVITEVVIFNFSVAAVTVISAFAVKVEINAGQMALIFLAFLIMQIEIAAICFGISAFIKNGGLGIGIGVAMLLYFINIVANISKEIEFLKYVTPFAYTESGYIIKNTSLDIKYLIIGIAVSCVSVTLAILHYRKKDIS